MLKISHKFFLVIIFFSLTALFVFTNTPWTEKVTGDTSTVAYITKNHECSVLIRRNSGKGNLDGVAIKTIEKPTRLGTRSRYEYLVIQWNFYSILNGSGYAFSLWGENYEEDSGPEISKKCLALLHKLPKTVQEELRTYEVPF
jgi:hypothetical protein